ncbi:MAG: DUF373 family protein [Thermoplasmatales archaeon]|nr:DUF373 family protein [Thermoplasmatales archaeon]
MKRTLILVVDRDNDFGSKGGVVTPIIGIDDALEAVINLGVADPEDSDVNALLAAVNIYKDLVELGADVEIALICGDQKVGHRSDSALVDELEEVISKVEPERAVLVGDGAEDEYIYPIVSSRVPIDSVKRVFVKQSPGLEGSLYIFSKILRDPGKRKRFLTPIATLLGLISLIYFSIPAYDFYMGRSVTLSSFSTPIVGLLISFVLLLYAFNVVDRTFEFLGNWVNDMRSGSVAAVFSFFAFLAIVLGVTIGVYAVFTMVDNNPLSMFMAFATNAMWPIVFAILINDMGKVINNYILEKKIPQSFMIGTIMVFGTAFIIQGVLDYTRRYLGYAVISIGLIYTEVAMGVLFTVIASILQASYKSHFKQFPMARSDE